MDELMDYLSKHGKTLVWTGLILVALLYYWRQTLLFVVAVAVSGLTAEFIAKDIGILIFVAYCFYLLFRFYRLFNND